MLLSVVIFIVLLIGAMYLAGSKLGIHKADIDIMFIGIFAFGAIRSLSLFLGTLLSGGGLALSYLIGFLIEGLICYYFYKKFPL